MFHFVAFGSQGFLLLFLFRFFSFLGILLCWIICDYGIDVRMYVFFCLCEFGRGGVVVVVWCLCVCVRIFFCYLGFL